MANTTVSVNNASKPAPKWFRKSKKALSILSDTTVVILLAMGYSESSLLMLILRIGLSGALEALETMLANGEIYASKLYVINEVDNLPAVGVEGQWYHLPDGGSLYFYYLNGAWHSVDNAAIGGGTVGTPK